jgi:hypothetical protein
MAAGGFCKLPTGYVVVALNLPSPAAHGTGSVRVLVHARNRARALTRLRNLGLRAVYLRGNAAPPTPDEVTAVLHHPDGLLWRSAPDTPHGPGPADTTDTTDTTDNAVVRPATTGQVPAQELWHPIRALLGPRPGRTTVG